MHIGSQAAAGADTEDAVKTKVWDAFRNRETKTVKGDKLHYYKNFRTRNVLTRELLIDKDGQCSSWAMLFRDVLRAQGVDSPKHVRAKPDLDRLLPALDPIFLASVSFSPNNLILLVKEWEFIGNGSAKDIIDYTPMEPMSDLEKLITAFPYINVPEVDLTMMPPPGDWETFRRASGYAWHYADVQDREGIEGQNNRNPASIFSNHQFVEMTVGPNVQWYDPSYGLTYAGATKDDRELAFDDQAIAGYGVLVTLPVKELQVCVDLNGNGTLLEVVSIPVLLFRKNTLGVKEIKSEIIII